MTKIASFFAAIRARIVDIFTTDTAELISELAALETKIEKAIEKDMRKANQMVEAARSLNAAMLAHDRNLNVAYKMLHNVSVLTQ